MASYPSAGTAGTFDQDKYNEPAVPQVGGGSGLVAGIESGLSSVEPVSGITPEQRSDGKNFMPCRDTGMAGTKGDKSFDFDPPRRGG